MKTQRNRSHLEEDFVITENGYYFGIGQVIDLLKMITELQLKCAQNSNPLTGLPGNLLIQEQIDQLIRNKKDFVACYFDLDNFKPYNDQYGYAKGDEILIYLAKLLKKHSHPEVDFVGHVGGDDYVVIFRSTNWQESIANILQEFIQFRETFYNPDDLDSLGIWAEDRFGEKRFFSLMSISVAAIDSSSASLGSSKDIASRLSLIKQEAKQVKGNSLVAELSGSLISLITDLENPPNLSNKNSTVA